MRAMSSVIITGATGKAGAGVLQQCLNDNNIRKVTAIQRSPLPEQLVRENPKLQVVIHKDFTNLSSIAEQLKGHDACFWCLGISQTQVSAEKYFEITHTYAIEGAKAMNAANPGKFAFCFLSGNGADSSEKSWTTFAKVKGKTENDLKKLGLGSVYTFRPAYIHNPDAPADKQLNFALRMVGSLMLKSKSLSIWATDIGKGMIQVARAGSDKFIFENLAIRELAAQYDQNK